MVVGIVFACDGRRAIVYHVSLFGCGECIFVELEAREIDVY